MTDEQFPAGHVFFRPGDPGDRAFMLNEGQVELLAGEPDKLVRVNLFGPGDVFGEMALIEERPRFLTARSVSGGRVSEMSRDEFELQLTQDPVRTRQYLRSLFERMRTLSARLGNNAEQGQDETTEPGLVEWPAGNGQTADWAVVIHPLTRKAAATLPEAGLLVTQFPLRVGRASGPRERDGLDLNDVWLLDEPPYHISRNHCEIECDREGAFIRDRGSQLGCIVNEQRIGGRAKPGHARLEIGDNVVVVGDRMSPYQFRVEVRPA